MSGTKSMALAMEQSFPNRRSLSSPDLLSLPSLDTSSSLSLSQSMSQAHLLDDSSIPSLSTFEIPSFNVDFGLDSLYSGNEPHSGRDADPFHNLSGSTRPQATPTLELAASATSPAHLSETWMSGSRSTQEASGKQQRRPISSRGKRSSDEPSGSPDHRRPPGLRETSSDSLLRSSKRSWMPSSRSLSPTPRPVSSEDKTARRGLPASTSSTKMKHNAAPKDLEHITNQIEDGSLGTSKSAPKSLARYFAKIKGKPASSSAKASEAIASNLSRASSSVSLGQPASSSIDTQTSISTCSETNVTTPSTTDASSVEMLPRVQDPLWSRFRHLDMDFKSFAAKTALHKVSHIKLLVLPFLKSDLSLAPIGNLRPEDVDRRATILNKWWSDLLDVLESQYRQPVHGVDRLIFLEAATLIMMRPEWRQTTSYFLPLSERSPKERVQTRSRSWTNASDTSQSSSQSAMLAESAEHNVRTMFVSNLVKQMAFVVDRMSLRHAPLSLVEFAGKTCAYAFFFAPGVADILVRLWTLTCDLIRRAGDELKLPRKDSGESDDIVALFPPRLGALGWTSPRTMSDALRLIPKMQLLVARIAWTGPWVSRWKGRDSDLFFVFCKHFHILSDQFMPPGLPLTEKARAPAFVLVHAQLLATMDATINRQAAAEDAHGSPSVDMVKGADAALTMPPLPPSNVMKGMSENRLIMLLKDMLQSDDPKTKGARHSFAEAFAALAKAATYRTPQFSTNGCFTLCDFLEAVLTIYSESETPENPTRYIDWDFWLDVCKKILASFTTTSQVRVIVLMYNLWDAVAKDPQRKLSFCRDWLLTEETFNILFTNWCPMVRTYYQRLLCWRICRDRGSFNQVDMEIFHLASKRLKTVWSHYLYLKQSAEESGRHGPSTAPMSPAMGKRLVIIRQEVNTPQPGLLMGSDSSNKASNIEFAGGDATTDGSNSLIRKDDKKKWSLLSKMLSLTGSGSQGLAVDATGTTSHSTDDELQTARREVAESRIRPVPSPSRSSKSIDSGRSSPVFEEPKYVFKFILTWQQPPMPLRERVLVQPRLPIPAQARICVRSPNASPGLPPVGFPSSLQRIAGLSQGGLIQEARNASSLDIPPLEVRRKTSATKLGGSGATSGAATPNSERLASLSSVSSSGIQFETGQLKETPAQPTKPTGIYEETRVYTGRALAEWSLVVAECNNFVERRRDEGVLSLGEVEVPLLGADGFRRIVS